MLPNGLTPARQAEEEAKWAQPTQRKLHQSHFTVPALPWKRLTEDDPGPPTDPDALDMNDDVP
jgi:hypothetical protein